MVAIFVLEYVNFCSFLWKLKEKLMQNTFLWKIPFMKEVVCELISRNLACIASQKGKSTDFTGHPKVSIFQRKGVPGCLEALLVIKLLMEYISV